MLGLKYGRIGDMISTNVSWQGFDVVGNPANGVFLSWLVVAGPIAVPILTMFTPFFVCLVFGEIVSGESSEGTLRMALARPISRSKMFAAKWIASLIYGLCLIFFLGISAYVFGAAVFGRGGLMATGTFRHPMLAWYGENEGAARLVLAYALTAVSMAAVGMIALFISTWLNNSLGAIGGAIMLLFAMLVVGEIPYFKPIEEYLLSTQLFVGQKVFPKPDTLE